MSLHDYTEHSLMKQENTSINIVEHKAKAKDWQTDS
jgi:hypothetical protein